MRYIIGLDIGIGSVGWSAVQYDEPRRLLDFGVRSFESGELEGGKDRTSQQRRRYRSAQRLVRRRSHRKHRIKAHLEKCGLVKMDAVNEYFRTGKNNIIELRVKGLDKKLSPQEIAACLINFCNKRGYRDFYEMDESEMTAEEKKTYLSERAGAQIVDERMQSGNYRSIAEMIQKDPYFCGIGEFRSYRNRNNPSETLQINRAYLKEECEKILVKQSEYYPDSLTKDSIERALSIIFTQRYFEEGPGKADDIYRKYKGFLDLYGKCRYYPEEKRGCRFTVLADIYSLVNMLSQYKYYNADGREEFTGALANDLIDFALKNGNIAIKDIKAICKEHNLSISTHTPDTKETLAKSLKYIKVIKPVMDSCGFDWDSFISQDFRDMDSYLNRIGICLAENQTPDRRIKELRKIEGLSEEIVSKLALKKFSGTANVSNKHMTGAIDAFLQGEIYGSYQANVIKQAEKQETSNGQKHFKLPSFETQKEDFEFYKNPVVCRAINEARKIINAIIGVYGSPYAINIEVASELNRCYDERKEIEKRNNLNEKNRGRIRAEIASLLGTDESEVTPRQIECYILGEQQNWKCMYSGRDIDKKACVDKLCRDYEVDHIIPYSLILDNTLNNKALVYASENQEKRQRTPLMYMNEQKSADFRGRVLSLYHGKKINPRKYEYLLTENLYGDILGEWKSRNINDTRYISKFMVRYLRENLLFNHDEDDAYRQTEVYAVKAAITSQMRRQWLNEKTWGKFDKKDLKSISLLDHAADAVVIACCMPAYVEIASVQNKLRNIYKSAKRTETDEYRKVKADCLETMFKFHGLKASVVEPLLSPKGNTPCLIPNLRDEVDIRFIEPHTFREFGGEEQKNMTDQEIFIRHKEKCREFYSYDPKFAEKLRPVIVSHKPDRSATGTISADNALSVKVIDGVMYEMKRVSILGLKKKQIQNIYSGDAEMLTMLSELMSGMKDDSTVQDALKARGEEHFVTKSGRRINKVTLKNTASGKKLIKNLPNGHHTVLDTTKYYCIELYHDTKGDLQMRGITYADLVKADGKLWLSENCQYPENYAKHCMYLHKWDYISVIDKKGNEKFRGYYVSAYNINQGYLYYALPTTATMPKKALSVAKKDKFTKIAVDILGKEGGEIKCGEPLLSITERE